ncbi:Glycosyl hydrolase family 20, catalytic domain [Mariprofundus aestuarium]|uniref:beta-N-acetylhexosaminidase n=1 Tax=Mariprofundus aestuarium TaxID=1921086 RepID=A0A2K8KXQ2_MARES|nr:family 20 glycosylhydrolase [Mariprofundus aestuarium]ATX79663.1 Glycosyl hydrolase family 20, catalytic domain [Mariprofundus aestuarium]
MIYSITPFKPNKFVFLYLAAIFYCFMHSSSAYSLDIPLPVKIYDLNEGVTRISGNSQLNLPESISIKYGAFINEIRQSISKLPINTKPTTINVMLINNKSSLPDRVRKALEGQREGFWMKTDHNNVQILVTDEYGALHALSILEETINRSEGVILDSEIIDWPALKFRGFLITPGPGVTASDIKAAISTARKARMNAVFLYINKRIAFETLKGVTPSDAISISEIKEIITYSNESGLEVIPVVNLLTRQSHGGLMLHAQRLGIPHTMYNKDTYNPNDPQNYQFVFSFLEEIIDVFQPNKLHIGHSEVSGCYPKQAKKMEHSNQAILPADLFLKDVLTIYRHLKNKGIETWMWGDMLVSHSEHPNMRIIGLNGNIPDYGKPLRQEIPKDIVIADWHYKDKQVEFPSSKSFASEGFQVVGTTWNKASTISNFTKYMSNNVGANGRGMIAGIWGFWKMSPEARNAAIYTSGNTYWAGE